MNPVSRRICRICSFKSSNNEPMFFPFTHHLTPIGEMYASCIMTKPEYNDGYPERVCLPCTFQLKMFHTFQMEAKHMQDMYKIALGKQIRKQNDGGGQTGKKKVLSSSGKGEQNNVISKPKLLNDGAREVEFCSVDNLSIDENVSTLNSDKIIRTTIQALDENYTDADVYDVADANVDEFIYEEVAHPYEELVGDTEKQLEFLGHDIKQEVEEAAPGEEEVRTGDADIVYLDEEFRTEPSDSETVNLQDDADQTTKPTKGGFCEFCRKYLRTVKGLINHKCSCKEVHKCPLCVRRFKSANILKVHVARHSNERPVQCDRCDKRFKNPQDLRIHMEMHNNIRKYACDICGTRFRAYTHMTDHREIHFPDTEYTCEYCGIKKNKYRHLVMHIRTNHTRKNTYTCPKCPAGFALSFRLKRHLLIHSRDEAKQMLKKRKIVDEI